MTFSLRRAAMPLLMTALVLVLAGCAVWFAVAAGGDSSADTLPVIQIGGVAASDDGAIQSESTGGSGFGTGPKGTGSGHVGTSTPSTAGTATGSTSGTTQSTLTPPSGDRGESTYTTVVTSQLRIQTGRTEPDGAQSTGYGPSHDSPGSNHDSGR